MKNTCRLAPVIKVRKNGETVEKSSQLFADIRREIKDYDTSWDMWAFTKTTQFKNEYGDKVSYDELGEVTFPSLIAALGWKDTYDSVKSVESAINEHNLKDRVFNDPVSAVTAMNDFNASEKNFTATVEKKNTSQYMLKISERNGVNVSEATEQAFNHALTGEIINFLRQLGFSIDFVSNPRYDGLFDPTSTRMKDGLLQIISIAKGERGEEALPEEFSHLIIEGMLNHPLVQRLLASISEEQMHEVLGEQFEDYSKEYNGDQQKLKKEVAGKMLAQHITRKGTISRSTMKQKQSLLSRIWAWIKKIFSNVSKSQLTRLNNNAEDAIAGIYDLLASNRAADIISINDVVSGDTMYKISKAMDSLEHIALRGERLKAKMANYRNPEGAYKTLSEIQELNQRGGSDSFIKSIRMYLDSTLKDLKEIEREKQGLGKAEEVFGTGSMKALNQLAKTIRSIDAISKGITDYISFIKSLGTASEEELDALDLSEEEARALSEAATSVDQVIDSLVNWAHKQKIGVITNAFSTVFKNNLAQGGLDTAHKILTLEQIIDHASRDINFVDRWFSALSDADDAFLAIFDKLVKNQQFERDTELAEYYKMIAHEDQLLREAGFTSDFIYERDEKGTPTTRLKSIYDFDSYLEARKKYAIGLRERQKKEGFSDRQYAKYLSMWEDGYEGKGENKKKRRIKVYVDPKADKLFREKGTAAVEEAYPGAVYEMLPNPELYDKNKHWLESIDPAQRRYYENMMDIKREMAAKIPHRGQHIFKVIFISKDLVESIFDNGSGNPLKTTADWCKRKFIRRPDDIGFGLDENFTTSLEAILKGDDDVDEMHDKILKLIQDSLDTSIIMTIEPERIRRILNKTHRYAESKKKAGTPVSKEKLAETNLEKILDLLASENVFVRTTDFSDNVVQRLPVYYSRPLQDMNMLSTDFTGALIAYAGMAINYEKMDEVVDILELARDYSKERKILQNEKGKPVMSKFTASGKIYKAYVELAGSTNIVGRLDDYMDSVVYEQRTLDVNINMFGTNISSSKVLDVIKDYTGLLGLGLNIFSWVSNVAVGKLQQWIEAAGGEYFRPKNYARGVYLYSKMMPEYVAEMASPVKKSKLSLLIEMFDPMDDYYENLRNPNNSKSAIMRILGNNQLCYIGMNAGEHMLHCQTMLAILDATTLSYKEGSEEKTISLLDALEVVERDGIYRLELKEGLSYEKVKIDNSGKIAYEEGITYSPDNPNYGKPLKDEDGKYIKEKIELKGNEIQRFIYQKKNIIRAVNDSLNGAFGANQKGAVHRYAVLRLVMQFRQWMPAHYERRFARGHYDARLDQWREGYYQTFAGFMFELAKQIKRSKKITFAVWNNLTDHEKANMRRASAEISEFFILLLLVRTGGKVSDKDRGWFEKMKMYQIYRMKLEVGASMPLNIGFLSNIIQVLRQPAAVLDTFEKWENALNIMSMFDEIQTGRYAGWTEWERSIYKLTPFDQVSKAYHFDESIFSQFEKD